MMHKGSDIIGWGSLLFWIGLATILCCLLPFFKNAFYNSDVDLYWLERLDVVPTPTPVVVAPPPKKQEELKRYITWAWRDFHGNQHEIQFHIDEKDTERAAAFREQYTMSSKQTLYVDFIGVSSRTLDAMCQAMSADMRRKNLTGQDALDYVVTAIQTPKYTKVTNKQECPCYSSGKHWLDDCRPRSDGRGCCNGVVPFGIFTPAEFITQKTGDCDTKALVAYALLKKLGYDAAVITGLTGRDGRHAMLALTGVKPVIRSEFVQKSGRIYYPWEVTNFYSSSKLGNMRMWNGWRDWQVIIN